MDEKELSLSLFGAMVCFFGVDHPFWSVRCCIFNLHNETKKKGGGGVLGGGGGLF